MCRCALLYEVSELVSTTHNYIILDILDKSSEAHHLSCVYLRVRGLSLTALFIGSQTNLLIKTYKCSGRCVAQMVSFEHTLQLVIN